MGVEGLGGNGEGSAGEWQFGRTLNDSNWDITMFHFLDPAPTEAGLIARSQGWREVLAPRQPGSREAVKYEMIYSAFRSSLFQ